MTAQVESADFQEPKCNNTEISDTEKSYTDLSETNPIILHHGGSSSPSGEIPDKIRWIEERNCYEKIIKHNIDYDIIVVQYGKAWLDEIVMLMVDVVCSKETYIRINKQEYPQEVVKSRFLKIDSSHIEYIEFALRENTSNVRNIRAFLITTIYRAFETSDNWYSVKVRHDMKTM